MHAPLPYVALTEAPDALHTLVAAGAVIVHDNGVRDAWTGADATSSHLVPLVGEARGRRGTLTHAVRRWRRLACVAREAATHGRMGALTHAVRHWRAATEMWEHVVGDPLRV